MTSTSPADPGAAARLDAALVARGLSRSRQTAAEAVREGRVRVNAAVVTKPAAKVVLSDRIEVSAADGEHFVSRAAHKLAGALDAMGIDVVGKCCTDVGASTGGFTQVLLERGAQHVVAIDVGTDQLVHSLREHPKVSSLEGTHVGRDDLSEIPMAELVVADLSFISLCHVMHQLAVLLAPDGDLVPMVKPQFEVGRSHLGKGGVVNDPVLHREAVAQVVGAAGEHGLHPQRIVTSPLPGPAGNVEFFVHLRRGDAAASFDDLWAARERRS